MIVNPGDLDKKITIYSISYNDTTDADGFYAAPTKTLVRTCWAQISNQSGREMLSSGAQFSEIQKRFLIRYTSTEIKPGMLITYGGTDYEITYANPFHDEHEYVELWAKEYERVVRNNG